jgi:hypothetical protein
LKLPALERSALFFSIFTVLMYSGFSCRKVQNLSPNNAGCPWQPDRGDGTYENPVLYADYSDPDVTRAGDDFFLISSSFQCTPGIPVLQSRDLVNWRIIGHVFAELPLPYFDRPRHGEGCWAPSIRFHNGEFYVYYGDPDFGIYMIKSKAISGAWESPVLVKEAKGWIDPCPLWDDDGNAYLIHAWAKSRAGFNSILTVNRMSPDGRQLLDGGTAVFDGHRTQPTIEKDRNSINATGTIMSLHRREVSRKDGRQCSVRKASTAPTRKRSFSGKERHQLTVRIKVRGWKPRMANRGLSISRNEAHTAGWCISNP